VWLLDFVSSGYHNTMLTMLIRYLLSLTTALRYFQETWSGPEVDKLLYLSIALLNSSLEKGSHIKVGYNEISNIYKLIWQFCTELKV